MPLVINELELEIIPEQEPTLQDEPATGTGEDARRYLEAKRLQEERKQRLEVD